MNEQLVEHVELGIYSHQREVGPHAGTLESLNVYGNVDVNPFFNLIYNKKHSIRVNVYENGNKRIFVSGVKPNKRNIVKLVLEVKGTKSNLYLMVSTGNDFVFIKRPVELLLKSTKLFEVTPVLSALIEKSKTVKPVPVAKQTKGSSFTVKGKDGDLWELPPEWLAEISAL